MAHDDHQFLSNFNISVLTTRIKNSPISTKILLVVSAIWPFLYQFKVVMYV